ncbi:MAG: hypothetical protein SF051_15160 [Elusimicrobiota bacterium]|nr:hypothetical protein [Elusimicrobiota bacterium]
MFFLVLGVFVAVVLIIVTRKSEIISHDPLEGARPPSAGGAPDAQTVLKLFKEGNQAEAIALFDKMKSAVEAAAENAEAADEDLDPELEDALLDLIQEGKAIEAIKLYREATGADLAAAKRAIDRIGSDQ